MRRAFTLIELLLVTAIVAFLIALFLPALLQVRQRSRDSACRTQLVQFGQTIDAIRSATPNYDFPRWDSTQTAWSSLAEAMGVRNPYANMYQSAAFGRPWTCPCEPDQTAVSYLFLPVTIAVDDQRWAQFKYDVENTRQGGRTDWAGYPGAVITEIRFQHNGLRYALMSSSIGTWTQGFDLYGKPYQIH